MHIWVCQKPPCTGPQRCHGSVIDTGRSQRQGSETGEKGAHLMVSKWPLSSKKASTLARKYIPGLACFPYQRVCHIYQRSQRYIMSFLSKILSSNEPFMSKRGHISNPAPTYLQVGEFLGGYGGSVATHVTSNKNTGRLLLAYDTSLIIHCESQTCHTLGTSICVPAGTIGCPFKRLRTNCTAVLHSFLLEVNVPAPN